MLLWRYALAASQYAVAFGWTAWVYSEVRLGLPCNCCVPCLLATDPRMNASNNYPAAWGSAGVTPHVPTSGLCVAVCGFGSMLCFLTTWPGIVSDVAFIGFLPHMHVQCPALI